MTGAHLFLWRRRRVIWIVCVVLWCAAFVATHIPGASLPRLGARDKTLHAVGFFVLAGSFLLSMMAHAHPRVRRIVVVLCVMMLYAALDEITQPAVGRSADIGDWLADTIGAAAGVLAVEVGMLVAALSRRRSDRREQQRPLA